MANVIMELAFVRRGGQVSTAPSKVALMIAMGTENVWMENATAILFIQEKTAANLQDASTTAMVTATA